MTAEQYTPTQEEVRSSYKSYVSEYRGTDYDEAGLEFDRWLAQHDTKLTTVPQEISASQATSANNTWTSLWNARDVLNDALNLNMAKILAGRGVDQPAKLKGKLEKTLALINSALATARRPL